MNAPAGPAMRDMARRQRARIWPPHCLARGRPRGMGAAFFNRLRELTGRILGAADQPVRIRAVVQDKQIVAICPWSPHRTCVLRHGLPAEERGTGRAHRASHCHAAIAAGSYQLEFTPPAD